MAAVWFVEVNGKQYGPFTNSQLIKLARSGELKPDYLVRKIGGPAFPSAQIAGLFDQGEGSAEPARPEGAQRSDAATILNDDPSETPVVTARLSPAPESTGVSSPIVATPVAEPAAGIPPPSASANRWLSAASVLVAGLAGVVITMNLLAIEKRLRQAPDVDGSVAAASAALSTPPEVVSSNPENSATGPSPTSTTSDTGQATLPAPGSSATASTGVVGPAQDTKPAGPTADPPAATNPVTSAASIKPAPSVVPAPQAVAAATTNSPAAPIASAPIRAGQATSALPRTTADLKRSFVRIRAPIGRASTEMFSGIVVDDSGTIATSPAVIRMGSVLEAIFDDGATSAVTGYVALASVEDLVLLKTTRSGTTPMPEADADPVVGMKVYVASPGIDGMVLSTSEVEAVRMLDAPLKTTGGATYLDAGLQVAVLRHGLPVGAHGGPVVDDRRQLIGVLSISPEGEQFVIDRRRLAALKTAPGRRSRTLADLRQFRLGPVDPRFSVQQPKGKPVAELVADIADAPPPPTVNQDPLPAWVEKLEALCARRGQLRQTQVEAESNLRNLIAQSEALDRDYRSLESSIRGYRITYASAEEQIARLIPMAVREPLNTTIRAQLDARETDRARTAASILKAEADAMKKKEEFAALQPQMGPAKEKTEQVKRDADRLRAEFMSHLRPFGAASKEYGDAGVGYFTSQIQRDKNHLPSLSFALFGRACAHLRRGDGGAALLDFDEALRTAPKEPLYLTFRGVSRVRSGDLDGGRKDLAEAVRVDDQDYYLRYHYALVLCRTGAWSVMEQQLKDAIKLAPEMPESFALMALLKATGDDKIRIGEYALRTAQTAYDLAGPQSWSATLALAAAHAEKGNFDLAVRYAQESISAADEGQAAFCGNALKTFQARQPLRLDWKSLDYWALQ
jgi:tetratricopeptide (TPR) repeat protein